MFAATGNVEPDPTPADGAGRRRTRPMAEPCRAAVAGRHDRRGSLVGAIARQRELSLVVVMLVLGGARDARGAAVPDRGQPEPGRGPRLDHRGRRDRPGARRHHPQHRPVGRGDDGPGRLLRRDHARVARRSTARAAILLGVGLGARAGHGQRRRWSRCSGCPSIVATLGTLSIFRGIDYLIAGSHQVPLAGPAGRVHGRGAATRSSASRCSSCSSSSPSSIGSVGPALDAVRAPGLRRRQQPRGGRDPGHPGPRRRVRRVHAVRPAAPGSPA